MASSGRCSCFPAADRSRSPTLEKELQRKLNFALVVRYRAGDACTARNVHSGVGIREVRMVEDVEHLGAELQGPTLIDLEILHRREVKGDQVWPAQHSIRRIAEHVGGNLIGSKWRENEHRLIVETIQGLLSRLTATQGSLGRSVKREVFRVAYHVRPRAPGVRVGRIER